jgi:pimeloyl-ACP methyl ester carboxylesterase
MATFALVHGSWHGAWCWERLSPLLQEAGHDVVATDLPCDDGAASFQTYADVVCDALKGCSDDVVLVGHSLAGTTIPLVAVRRPVRHLVYLCALIPDIGRSLFDQFRDEPVLNPAYVKGLIDPR